MENSKKNKIISTSISEELYQQIKAEHLKVNYLIQLGLIAHKNNPNMNRRIDDLALEILKIKSELRIHSRLLARVK